MTKPYDQDNSFTKYVEEMELKMTPEERQSLDELRATYAAEHERIQARDAVVLDEDTKEPLGESYEGHIGFADRITQTLIVILGLTGLALVIATIASLVGQI